MERPLIGQFYLINYESVVLFLVQWVTGLLIGHRQSQFDNNVCVDAKVLQIYI